MTTKIAGKRVYIIVAHEFEDIELLYPLLRLNEEGAEVVVVPVPIGFHPRPYFENKPVTGRFGHPVPIPVMPEGKRYKIGRVDGLRLDEVDCILIPGGFSPDYLRRHQGLLQFIRQADEEGKVLAAICHGPWVFISAGIVRGHKMTGLIAVKDDLINAGAEYVDAPAVRDQNIVTARLPGDLPEFCQEIIAALNER